MRVVLIRHSLAVDPYGAPTDETRWLTDDGRVRMRQVAAELARLGLNYSAVYTSPLVRAVQTAEILAHHHPSFEGPIEVHPPLCPDHGTTAQALSPLDRAGSDDVVVFVGHEPKIRVLAGHLSGLGRMPGFQPGSVCLVHVDVAEGRGAFEWMMDPRDLERALSPDDVRR